MPTWCHLFNSSLTGNARVWFDDLPTKSIDSYDDPKKAFMENYLQQKKCIKDLIELHNIKQWDGESTEDFVRRYKLESMDVKGSPKCMRIFGFMHEITNPELIKRLHDKIPKAVDEMMRVTTSFLRGEVAASNHERKKSFPPWKQQEEILFPPLDDDEGIEGPMIIETEIGGHYIHRMANTTTGKDWKRRTLRFGLDEFRGCKVTIFVQQNYWKTRSQKIASSSINSSRNAEAPGRRRSNYPKKQQVGLAGMCEEVGKLVEAGIMKEVHYHDWLSNPVMVKKHDDSWRMCVDFKDLNKACPKDGYPLSEIDGRWIPYADSLSNAS
ncbi:reverse transcriptase domain-containing protein [Tanacetum coccineum]